MNAGRCVVLALSLVVLAGAPASAQRKPRKPRLTKAQKKRARLKRQRAEARALANRWLALATRPREVLPSLPKVRIDNETHYPVVLQDEERLAAERERVLVRLRDLGDRATQPLLSIWKKLPPPEGAMAIVFLGNTGDLAALPAILEAAQRTEVVLQRAAAGSLTGFYGRTQNAKLRTRILETQLMLSTSRDYDAANGAWGFLRQVPVEESWQPLFQILIDELTRSEGPRELWVGGVVETLAVLLSAFPSDDKMREVFGTMALVAPEDEEELETESDPEDDEDPGEEEAKPVNLQETLFSLFAEAGGNGLVQPYLRRLLREAYGLQTEDMEDPDGVESVFAEDLTEVMPYTAEIKRMALEGLGKTFDAENIPLFVEGFKSPDRRTRETVMLASRSAFRWMNAEQKIASLKAAHKLLADPSDRLRFKAWVFLKGTTGMHLPRSYRQWTKHIETFSIRLYVEDHVRRVAEESGMTLAELYRANGAKNLDDYVAEQDYESLAEYWEFNAPKEDEDE